MFPRDTIALATLVCLMFLKYVLHLSTWRAVLRLVSVSVIFLHHYLPSLGSISKFRTNELSPPRYHWSWLIFPFSVPILCSFLTEMTSFLCHAVSCASLTLGLKPGRKSDSLVQFLFIFPQAHSVQRGHTFLSMTLTSNIQCFHAESTWTFYFPDPVFIGCGSRERKECWRIAL